MHEKGLKVNKLGKSGAYAGFRWYARINNAELREAIDDSVSSSHESLALRSNWAPTEVYRPFLLDKERQAHDIQLDDAYNAGMSDVGTRNMLFSLIMSTNPALVVELGSHIGIASVIMGAALRVCGAGRLVTVDPSDMYHETTKRYISSAGLEARVSVIKGYSCDEAVLESIRKIGMITILFIDAVHEFDAVYRELELYFPLVVEGGFIVLHDTSSVVAKSFDPTGKGGVRKAVQEFGRKNPEFVFTSFDWPAWLHPCGLVIGTKSVELLKSGS